MDDLVNREDVIKEIRVYWSEKLDDIPVAMCDGNEEEGGDHETD